MPQWLGVIVWFIYSHTYTYVADIPAYEGGYGIYLRNRNLRGNNPCLVAEPSQSCYCVSLITRCCYQWRHLLIFRKTSNQRLVPHISAIIYFPKPSILQTPLPLSFSIARWITHSPRIKTPPEKNSHKSCHIHFPVSPPPYHHHQSTSPSNPPFPPRQTEHNPFPFHIPPFPKRPQKPKKLLQCSRKRSSDRVWWERFEGKVWWRRIRRGQCGRRRAEVLIDWMSARFRGRAY